MTWAEFQLRLFAYNRIQKNQWLKITELSTNVLIAGFIDGKDKKKRINEIRKSYLGESKPKGLSDLQREAILKAQQQYNNKE
tara:strand:- start:438 stop:683 length:246 start_codon:yes stop_codon:yes gene_type:complete